MRIAALFTTLVGSLALVGAGCLGGEMRSPAANPDEPFRVESTLSVGGEFGLADGLRVRLDRIDDSRCKKGVVCVWQGELSPVLAISGGAMTLPVEVRLGTERAREVTVAPYYFSLLSATAGDATFVVEKHRKAPAKDDKINVTNPTFNQVVTSPLTVTGEARGPWYFEASFPVKLLDANGKVLVQTHAQAQGDWMTSEFVPFTSTLTFAKPTTATGTLVLEKDNASGLPEHDDSRAIEVRFAPAQ
jgi:hypothetical protein